MEPVFSSFAKEGFRIGESVTRCRLSSKWRNNFGRENAVVLTYFGRLGGTCLLGGGLLCILLELNELQKVICSVQRCNTRNSTWLNNQGEVRYFCCKFI